MVILSCSGRFPQLFSGLELNPVSKQSAQPVKKSGRHDDNSDQIKTVFLIIQLDNRKKRIYS